MLELLILLLHLTMWGNRDVCTTTTVSEETDFPTDPFLKFPNYASDNLQL